MEQGNSIKDGDNAAEGLAQPQASEKKSPNLSKAKSDIARSMAKNFVKTRKFIEFRRRKQMKKNKSVLEGNEATENDAKKQDPREENPQKDASTSTVVHQENSQQIKKNEENTHGSGSKEKGSKLNGGPRKRRRGEGRGLWNRNWKNEERQRGRKRRKQYEQVVKNIKENSGGQGRKQENKMNGKICGLIFLCNAKTKPDCFRYRVMGLSDGKKDLVLGIRRGFKLFLYDYDLKLMYGVYEAVTSGRMNIEPEAFGGAFPAQVRFSVHKDCLPLAESIFKKAIKENYNKNNKFKTELTATQVRKLANLFRPVAVHSTALPVRSPPSSAPARNFERPKNREARDRPREARDRPRDARDRPRDARDRPREARDRPRDARDRPREARGRQRDARDRPRDARDRPREARDRPREARDRPRDARDRPREARPPSDREASARDPYANVNARSYPVLSHERDRQITYEELASTRREDIHRDLYLNGDGYGAHGFQGDRRHSSFETHMAPRLGSYHRDYKEQPLSQPDIVYRESVPMQRDTIPPNPLFLTEREYRTYGLGATQGMQSTVSAATANTSVAAASTLDSYSRDPFYSRSYGAPLDSYPPRPGGEAHLIETDRLRRRENNQLDSAYARYESDAIAEYNQKHRHQNVKPVGASSSVSHRYTFDGGSFSYR